MTEPLVSVGLPTYNRPGEIERAIEDIRSQTYKNLEIIISDNATQDPRIREIFERYRSIDPRIKTTIQETNIGIIDNFRFVLQQATGKYFVYAQDDDCHHLEFIESLLAPVLEDPSVKASVCGTVWTINGSLYKHIDASEVSERPWPLHCLLNAMRDNSLPTLWMMLWDTDTLKDLDKHRIMMLGKDIVVAAEMLMSYRVAYVSRYLYTKEFEHDKIKNLVRIYPLGFFSQWYHIIKTLALSKHIPLERKVWIPVIATTNAVWVMRAYIAQIVFLLPVDHPLRKAIRKVAEG